MGGMAGGAGRRGGGRGRLGAGASTFGALRPGDSVLIGSSSSAAGGGGASAGGGAGGGGGISRSGVGAVGSVTEPVDWIASVFVLQEGGAPAAPVRGMECTIAIGDGDCVGGDGQLVDSSAIRSFVEEELRGVVAELLVEPNAISIPIPPQFVQLMPMLRGVLPAPIVPALSYSPSYPG